MRYTSWRLVVITILAILSLLSGRLAAQNRNTGEIRGTVTDASGGRVPGVSVQITNTLTGVTIRAVSDSTGTYDAPFLQTGTYSLTFHKEGFEVLERTNVNLPIEVITIDAQLLVGAVTQTVTVNAASPLIQSESSDRKASLGSSEIEELPFVGRNEFSVLELAPGANYGDSVAAGSGNGGSSARVGFNGMRPYEFNAITDGGNATYPLSYNLDVNTIPSESHPGA